MMNKYFVFTLDGQHYAMEVSMVGKVIYAVELIYLPETPEFLLGLINMGGKIIPVANIRKQFNMPDREIDLDDRIIISQISTWKIAFIVDKVEGIVEFSKGRVNEVHQIFPEMKCYIGGVGKFNDNTVLIITFEKLFSAQNISGLEKVIKEQD